MREVFLNLLFSLIKCDVCGQSYGLADIEIIGHQESLWFVNASCGFCQNRGLIVLVIKESDATGIAADLVRPEGDKFAQSRVVGIDDVLDMHNFLREFNGDFAGILAER